MNNTGMYNNSEHYGLIAILLHWLMALVIFVLFGLGIYMVELTYYDAFYYASRSIHKSVGMLMRAVFVFWITWNLINPSPAPVTGTTVLEARLSRLVKFIFFLVIAVILISGYLIPTAAGKAISVFELFSVPATINSIPEQEYIAGLVHQYLAYLLIALAVLHAAVALKHHFVNRDSALRRMLGLGR